MKEEQKESTPIYFDAEQSQLIEYFQDKEMKFSKLLILVDENTHEFCLPNLMEFTTEFQDRIEIIEIESGEENKSYETAINLIEAILELGADRNSILINLGGGVISDLGGFVASIFKRGIRFINIPTTLLGMVDASLGGKTGVDLGFYKNQIGTFKHPEAIFVYPDFLETLPKREIKSGFAEIVKCCLIDDKAYFEAIENSNYEEFEDWGNLIQLSMTIKSEIVTDDPYENGIRKILNFGHTLGHAIESYSLKNDEHPISHGEAVAVGILMESWISTQVFDFPSEDFKRIENFLLENFGKYPLNVSQFDEIFQFLKQDKKNSNNQYFPILLKQIGKPEFETAVSEEVIRRSLDYYQSINS